MFLGFRFTVWLITDPQGFGLLPGENIICRNSLNIKNVRDRTVSAAGSFLKVAGFLFPELFEEAD